MSEKLRRPAYWLVSGLEWPSGSGIQYAECGMAFAPSFIAQRMVSEAGATVRKLADAIARDERKEILFFSEITNFLRQEGHDWPAVGVSDRESTLIELSNATPTLMLTLSQDAHFLVCMVGVDAVYSHAADGAAQGNKFSASDLDELRANLNARLRQDWPAYIESLERKGKLRTS